MAGTQQQAASAPESAWIPFVRSMYPSHLQRPHFFPPLFFNRAPCTVATVEGQVARVTVNPPPPPSARSRQQRRARRNPPPPPPLPPSSQSSASSQLSSPAGAVFTDNPAGLQDEHVQDSDLQGDEAQYWCLRALESLKEVMMVISQLKFRKYLDDRHNPKQHINPTNVIAQLPSIAHPSIPHKIADGECDIIVLHRQHGILVAEVKSVGGRHFSEQPPANQDQIIARVVTKAIKQLENQETALKHLVHDMAGGNIRVTKALLLPNITTAQLTSAASSSQQFQADLCRCTQTPDMRQAVSKCLSADHMQQPLTWWQNLWTRGPDPSMSDAVYERLLARFCGPASTVDVPTAGRPCKVLRTLGQAVAESGLRFSSLVLTPRQVELLNAVPEPQYLYLQGPPGCGKTIALVLKALQWARRGIPVVLASERDSAAVRIVVEEQLFRMMGSAAACGNLQRHCCDMYRPEADVSELVQLLGSGPDPEAFVLFDEVPQRRLHFIQWITTIRDQLPRVSVWAAGLWKWDFSPTRAMPSWLEVWALREPLRCPSAVTKQVASSGLMNDILIPGYLDPPLPLPTEGPPVQKLRHEGEPGHTGNRPLKCVACADRIGHILTQELRIGEPDHPRYKDTWIVCWRLPEPADADVLVQRLHHYGVPARAVSRPPSDADARELALAVTDQVIVTDKDNVQGLERTVVIVLGGLGYGVGRDFLSCSRSTSFLCVIH